MSFAFPLMSAAQTGYQGGHPWQVGDMVVCFGNGTCNVVRINGTTTTLLDQFSDSGSVSVAGSTLATANNNNLHLFVTDAGTGTSSNIVEYTIASVDQYLGTPKAHTPLHVFDGSAGTGSEGIVGLALDAQANMFVANSNPATIVELNQAGAAVGSYPLSAVTTTPAWQPNNLYSTPGAAILDPAGHVQTVLTAGTSGTQYPAFNQGGGNALDNAVMWTDLGAKLWTAKTSYPLNQVVIDPSSHLQQVVSAGTSGPKQPTWNDQAGTTKDGQITWQDRGPIVWIKNHVYSLPRASAPGGYDPSALAAGPSSHLEQVTLAGTSGPNPPTWGSTTTDGLTWSDQGSPVGKSCIENQVASMDLSADAGAVFFTAGPGGIVEKVSAPVSGASTCTVVADFGPNVILHGIRVLPPNSMPAKCGSSQASCPNGNGGILVVATGTQFVDTDGDAPGTANPDANEFSGGQDIRDVCTGASVPGTSAPPGPVMSDSCAILLDAGNGGVIATYPVSTVNSLQAVALDPLIVDCSGAGSCTSSAAYPATGSIPPAMAGNFWLADAATSNFYQVSLGTGQVSNPFNANGNNITQVCSSCPQFNSIQSIGVYAGEGANQTAKGPLTKLFAGNLSAQNNYTQVVYFPPVLPASSSFNPANFPYLNILTATATGFSGNLNLYASLIDPTTGNNDFNMPCRATAWNPQSNSTSPDKCVIWKVDADTPQLITEKFASENSSIDVSTDVFVDEAYDTTTSVGNFDPTGYKTSVHSLHEITGPNNGEVNANCTYGGNLYNRCFQNPNNITFKFTCTAYPGASLQNYGGQQPNLVIVQDPFPLPTPAPAPQPICQNLSGGTAINQSCQLSGTGGTTNWRFDSTANQWVFNWNVAGQGSYTACTFDPTDVNTPFCVNYSVATSASCP